MLLDLDIFVSAILVLFLQYMLMLAYIKLLDYWSVKPQKGLFLTNIMVGTAGYVAIIYILKGYHGYTFVSLDFAFARNCLGLIVFMLISKIYGLMPMEFLVRHLSID